MHIHRVARQRLQRPYDRFVGVENRPPSVSWIDGNCKQLGTEADTDEDVPELDVRFRLSTPFQAPISPHDMLPRASSPDKVMFEGQSSSRR